MRKSGRALLAVVFAVGIGATSHALEPIDTSPLVNAISAEKLQVHLRNLQAIADENGGTRALGTPGYADSVRYVADRLKRAGYRVQIQPFVADFFEEHSPPRLVRRSPAPRTFRPNVDFFTMTYSGAGDVSAELALAGRIIIPPTADPSSRSGCNPSDFSADVAGKVVLIQRGWCTFFRKAVNAENAGAVGAIIFNEGQPGREEPVSGTLGEELGIPVVGTSFAIGEQLYNQVQGGATVVMRLKVDAETTPTRTSNVLAEVKGTNSRGDIVVGAHLDSVPEGPGINDNGSGTAAILAIAEELAKLTDLAPRNTVRFAFWGAEEGGLFGSNHYVADLSPQAFDDIALNLNFDMVGSPNYVRFVYDGDGTIGPPGPDGSDVIEEVFEDFFASRGLQSEPTLFDGRSDYFAFIQSGIPAGGLFSGAEEVKTPREARIYGGVAGRPYDRCYHEACDTIRNVNNRALAELGKAAAHAVMTFAFSGEDLRSRGRSEVAAAKARAEAMDYRGPRLVR